MRRQRGFALLTAIMVGTLLVVIVAAGMAYLISSGRFLSAGQTRDAASNAAQAGAAWAIANFDSGSPGTVATSDVTYGSSAYSIAVANDPGQGYVVTATGWPLSAQDAASGHIDPAQVRTIRTIIQPTNELAQYAIASGGGVLLENHTFVSSRPQSGLGSVRSDGNVALDVHSSADGTVYSQGSVTVDSHSHAWAGTQSGASPITLPTYTTAQILQFQAEAKASMSEQIPGSPLPGGPGGWGPRGLPGISPAASGSWGPGPGGWWIQGNLPATISWAPLPGEQAAGACGGSHSLGSNRCGPELAGYYYSYPQYDVTTPQSNGLTLELRSGNYQLDGTMFVAGKLLIHDGTTLTGEGKIIATEGISIRDHVGIYGDSKLAHLDLVSLFGDIEIRHHSVLGQLNSGFVGRRGDPDDLVDLRDQDDPTGQYSAGDDHQPGQDDNIDTSYRDSYLPDSDQVASALSRLGTWLLPPAYADDGQDQNQGDGQDQNQGGQAHRAAPPGFRPDGHGADQDHGDDWKSRYSAAIPVGCTVWAQTGNVRFFEHSTLLGNIISEGTVTVANHCDIVRNSADPVLSVGLESWQATSYQNVK